jgi:hypothetical protein
MNPVEIIQKLPEYMQAVYSDGILCLSNNNALNNIERKKMLLENIASVKAQLEVLEQAMKQE